MSEKVHQVARNSLVNGLAFAVVALVGFINVSLIVRYYGIQVQGLVALGNLLSTKGYFAIVVFGLPTLISRKIAHHMALSEKEVLKDWIYSSYLLTLILGLFFSAVIGLIFLVPSGQDFLYQISGLSMVEAPYQNWFVAILVFSLPLQFFSIISQSILFGAQDFVSIRSSEVLFSILNLITIVLMIYFSLPGGWILVSLPIFEVFKGFYLLWKSHQIFPMSWVLQGKHSSVQRNFRKEMKVFTASSLMAFLDNTAPAMFVSHILGIQGLGVYDTLTKASKILKTIFGFFNAAILPHSISVEAKRGEQSVSQMFLRTIYLIGFAVMPLAFIIGSVSKDILLVWLGTDFSQYGKEFFYSLLFVIIMTIVGIQGSIFSARLSVTRKMIKVNFLENVLGLPLLYFQAQSQGILGVFLNRFIVIFVGLIFRTLAVCKEYGFKFSEFLYRFRFTLPVSILFYVLLCAISVSNPVFNLAGAFVCLTICWILLFFLANTDEKKVLLRMADEMRRIIAKISKVKQA